jgi:hypothetical protein
VDPSSQAQGSSSESVPSPALDACEKDAKKCSSLDIDHPRAREAYQIGCDKKDAYSCFKLGQYLDVKETNAREAVKLYDTGCKIDPQNKMICDAARDKGDKLCYLENISEFCRGEPMGEYRILVFRCV